MPNWSRLSLHQLPLEICEVISLYSENDTLRLSCCFFRSLYSNLSFQTKFLLSKFNIWHPSYNIYADLSCQSLTSATQWIELIESGQLTERIAMHIFHIGLKDIKTFVPIAAEFSVREGYHNLLHDLLLNAPSIVSPCMTVTENESTRNIRRGLDQITRDRSLIQAALCGHESLIQLLLRFEAKVDYDDYAALKMAAKYGHHECVLSLLHAKCKVEADDHYALCWAARGGHVQTVKILLDSGADMNARRGTPLSWAAEHGSHAVVSLLLQKGAEVHFNDDYALRWSSVRGYDKIVKLLLDYRADVHAVQDFPIRNAIKFGHVQVVEVLLQYGADPCACEKEAISWAVRQNNQEMLRLLGPWLSVEEQEKETLTVHLPSPILRVSELI